MDLKNRGLLSTRALLIYALAFFFVAVALAEVQRRALVFHIAELIERQDRGRKSEIGQLQEALTDQSRRIAEMHSAVGVLQVLTKYGRFASDEDVKWSILDRLKRGKKIIIHFDDSELENRDAAGNILCGPETASGYLGVFVAGADYVVSYNAQNHQWSGVGPAQNRPKCLTLDSEFGPKELRTVVTPQEAIVLWGGRFDLRGLNVYLSDQKVGRVAWVE